MKILNKNKNGNCYQSAFDNFVYSNKDYKLVHGEVIGQGAIKGIKYGHAWVEVNGFVIDKSNGNDIYQPIPVYYAIGRITKVKKYTAKQVIKNIVKYEHYGPWKTSE